MFKETIHIHIYNTKTYTTYKSLLGFVASCTICYFYYYLNTFIHFPRLLQLLPNSEIKPGNQMYYILSFLSLDIYTALRRQSTSIYTDCSTAFDCPQLHFLDTLAHFLSKGDV